MTIEFKGNEYTYEQICNLSDDVKQRIVNYEADKVAWSKTEVDNAYADRQTLRVLVTRYCVHELHDISFYTDHTEDEYGSYHTHYMGRVACSSCGDEKVYELRDRFDCKSYESLSNVELANLIANHVHFKDEFLDEINVYEKETRTVEFKSK